MDWKKSSFCDAGVCIEVADCEQGACVEVGFLNASPHLIDGKQGIVAIRNSQVPGEVIWCDGDEWAAFVAGVKAGEFDR